MTSRGGIKNVVIEGFVLVRFFFLLLFLSSLQILPASVFPFIILNFFKSPWIFGVLHFAFRQGSPILIDVMYSNKQRRWSSSRDWTYPLYYHLAALDEDKNS